VVPLVTFQAMNTTIPNETAELRDISASLVCFLKQIARKKNLRQRNVRTAQICKTIKKLLIF
jgi:hypothetical protein